MAAFLCRKRRILPQIVTKWREDNVFSPLEKSQFEVLDCEQRFFFFRTYSLYRLFSDSSALSSFRIAVGNPELNTSCRVWSLGLI